MPLLRMNLTTQSQLVNNQILQAQQIQQAKQAQQAQFIVVSLRRPMIEASERTIGVTQARGTHTQVLGIKV